MVIAPRGPVTTRHAHRGAIVLALVLLAGCSDPGDTPVQATRGVASPGPEAQRNVEQVAFDSDGVTLRGDLYLPDGSGPHPGVVLVGGSGPVDRDASTPGQLGMGFPTRVTIFADVAGALRDAGYAVLTYDKRTCGPFNECSDNGYPRPPDDLTVDVFVADAVAAVGHLRARDDVRSDAVAVAGHSQGGSFVPPMLIDDPDLAAGIMLSTPYDPIDEVLAAQADHIAGLSTLAPDPSVEQVAAQQRELAEQVRALRSGSADDDTMLGGASAGFWRSWMRVTDGVPQLATQVEQPLLVLGGALDTNVPSAQLQRWRQTLAGDRHRVVTLECVTHALNCLATDDLADLTPADVGTTVDATVSATLVEFLDAHMP